VTVTELVGVAAVDEAGEAPESEEPLFPDDEFAAGPVDIVDCDAGAVGVELAEALVLGLAVGVGLVVGLGVVDCDGDGELVGDCEAAGDDDANWDRVGPACVGAEDAWAPVDWEHCDAGMDMSAITEELPLATRGGAPGPGSVAPMRAACAAGACASAASFAAVCVADCDRHGVTSVLERGEGTRADGVPVAPGEPAGTAGPGALPPELPPGTPVALPSTLADCPPVSTLELAWTIAWRSGATASVADTTNAMPARTAVGRNQV
jgi:hypothetical protein